MEPDKEAGGGGSFEQMKENVSYGAGRKHHLFFFFFFNFFFNFFNFFFSSFPSFPLLLIVVYSYFLHFHLHLDLPPHCSFSTMLLPVRVFLPYFCYSLVSFIFFSVRYFILLFFPLFSFLFFFFFLIIRSFFFRLSFPLLTSSLINKHVYLRFALHLASPCSSCCTYRGY